MPTSSSTIKVEGMSEVEAGRVLSRLHHMQKVGLLSKEVEIEESHTDASTESLRVHTYGGL